MLGACNNAATNEAKPADSTAAPATAAAALQLDYPYTLPEPYANWQPGDQQHAVNVMKALQAYEKGRTPDVPEIDKMLTEMERLGGRGPFWLHGKAVRIGAFLPPVERTSFAERLKAALHRARTML